MQDCVTNITDKLTKLKGLLKDEDNTMDAAAFLDAVTKKLSEDVKKAHSDLVAAKNGFVEVRKTLGMEGDVAGLDKDCARYAERARVLTVVGSQMLYRSALRGPFKSHKSLGFVCCSCGPSCLIQHEKIEVKWGLRTLMALPKSKSTLDGVTNMQKKHLNEEPPKLTRAILESTFGQKIINEVQSYLGSASASSTSSDLKEPKEPVAKRARRAK